jgi:hypothetical protein
LTKLPDGAYLLDLGDGKLERIRLVGKELAVEHYFPAASYPNGKPILGTGTKE